MACSHHDTSPGPCTYCYPPLTPAQKKEEAARWKRKCTWCGRYGADLLVNRTNWYHRECDALLGCL